MAENNPVSICEILCCICKKINEIELQNAEIISLLTCDCKNCDCDKKDKKDDK